MPTLLVIGYGPGNSHATAARFAAEGYAVALVGRNEERLQDGVTKLGADGARVTAHHGDASDPASLRSAIEAARRDQGPISAVLLTAYRSGDVSNVVDSDPKKVTDVFRIGVVGLLTAVQAVHDDLFADDTAAVLVVNGAAGDDDSSADQFATSFGVDGVALESAAKSKLVGLLAERLRAAGIYVAELVINGTIKGSPFASPTAIDPVDVAERLWNMTQERTETRVRIEERQPER